MTTRAERLQAFVKASESEPVVWGTTDCCAWPAQWVKDEAGRTLALPAYKSRDEAQALIKAAGSLIAVIAPVMADAGFATTDFPVLGDVGVIALSDRDVGVIFAEGGYAVWRGEPRGSAFIKPRNVLAAWTI